MKSPSNRRTMAVLGTSLGKLKSPGLPQAPLQGALLVNGLFHADERGQHRARCTPECEDRNAATAASSPAPGTSCRTPADPSSRLILRSRICGPAHGERVKLR